MSTPHLYIIALIFLIFFTVFGGIALRTYKNYENIRIEKSDEITKILTEFKDSIIWWERQAI